MTEPTLPVSQPTAKEFWGTLFGTGPEYADANMCSFAEHYAAYVTAERDRELQQAREELVSAHWEAAHQQECRIKVEQSLSEAREELARLKKEWIPVSDLPKNNGLFLGFVPPNIMGLCLFVEGAWMWPDDEEDREAVGLTLWQELRPPLAVPEKPDTKG